MAGRKRKTGDYVVGYRQPPVAGRFSSANQPARRKPLVPDRKSTLALGQERVSVRLPEGTIEKRTADDLVLDKLIERALAGKLGDVRDLYRRLDAEEDAMQADPMVRVSKRQQKMTKEALKRMLRHYLDQAEQLVALGIAHKDTEGRLRLQPWARSALHLR